MNTSASQVSSRNHAWSTKSCMSLRRCEPRCRWNPSAPMNTPTSASRKRAGNWSTAFSATPHSIKDPPSKPSAPATKQPRQARHRLLRSPEPTTRHKLRSNQAAWLRMSNWSMHIRCWWHRSLTCPLERSAKTSRKRGTVRLPSR